MHHAHQVLRRFFWIMIVLFVFTSLPANRASSAARPFQVRTAALALAPDCRTYASADVPKAIPDQGTMESVLAVPDALTITDVDVVIGQLTHTYDEDLDIVLVHPDGSIVELTTDNGGTSDDYTNTRFDDEAAAPVTAGLAPFTGRFRPEASLAALDGKSASGEWRLRVADDAKSDTGALQGWSLVMCYGYDPDFSLTVTPTSLDACQTRDAAYTVEAAALSEVNSAVALSVAGQPEGSTASFTPASIEAPGTSILTIGGLSAAAPGSYPLTITGDDGNVAQQKSALLNLFSPATGSLELAAPIDGAARVAPSVSFVWSDIQNEGNYTIEIALDPGFANIVHSAHLPADSTAYNGVTLDENTQYYWRVRAANPCGEVTSTAFTFYTAVPTCATYVSEDVPKSIPDNSTVASTIEIPSAQVITDVDVILDWIIHPYVSDLGIYLIHPDGAVVELSTSNGESYDYNDDYKNTRFDDDAAASITTGGAPFTGSFRPESPLSALNGKPIQGIWYLSITDTWHGDVGQLSSWRMVICSISSENIDYSDLPASYGAAWHTGDGTLRIGQSWTADTSFAPGADDDTDDGIAFTSSFFGGQVIELTVSGVPTSGRWLRAWFDWDGDGVFEDDSGELAYDGAATDGDNHLSITLPAGLTEAVAYRVRLYDSPAEPTAGAIGAADGGEVTDGYFPVPRAYIYLPVTMK